MDHILHQLGDALKREIVSKRIFRRGGMEVFEIVFGNYKPGIDLLAWVRQPIDERYLDEMENPVIRCEFLHNDAANEAEARKKIAGIFDTYWKVIGELAPYEERHGL